MPTYLQLFLQNFQKFKNLYQYVNTYKVPKIILCRYHKHNFSFLSVNMESLKSIHSFFLFIFLYNHRSSLVIVINIYHMVYLYYLLQISIQNFIFWYSQQRDVRNECKKISIEKEIEDFKSYPISKDLFFWKSYELRCENGYTFKKLYQVDFQSEIMFLSILINIIKRNVYTYVGCDF